MSHHNTSLDELSAYSLTLLCLLDPELPRLALRELVLTELETRLSHAGIRCVEIEVPRAELMDAEEIWLTSSVREILPATDRRGRASRGQR